MIDFDLWQQKIETQLDRADFAWSTKGYSGAFSNDLRTGEVILDYYGIVSQMDEDDCEHWQLEVALLMDACHHELSTMTM
jgi:hypothetical protein